MRRGLVAVISGFLAVATASSGLAEVKVGAQCSKIGVHVVAKGGSLVCTQVGKTKIYKLVSKRGASAPAKSSASPAPTALPTPLPTPTSMPEVPTTQVVAPTPMSTPSTSLNQGLADSMSLQAFDSIINYYGSQPSLPSGALIEELSPHANSTLLQATLTDLQRGSQFWQKFTGVNTKIRVVFADRSDLEWFRDKMVELQPGGTEWLQRITDLAKSNPDMQLAGANGYDRQNNFLFFFLPGTSTTSTSSGWLGVGPHEWTHTAQQAISGNINRLPCWFKEGQASLFGNAISNSDRNAWAGYWKNQLRGLRTDFPAFYSMSSTDLTSWFTSHTYNMPNNVCGPDGAFMIGAMATEYLVGTLGVDKVNALVAELSKGSSWESYLEKLSGKPIEQEMADIVDYILKVRTWLNT